ncbi:unnamed protein product, partial [Heterotrigona itama]
QLVISIVPLAVSRTNKLQLASCARRNERRRNLVLPDSQEGTARKAKGDRAGGWARARSEGAKKGARQQAPLLLSAEQFLRIPHYVDIKGNPGTET